MVRWGEVRLGLMLMVRVLAMGRGGVVVEMAGFNGDEVDGGWGFRW